MLDGRLPLVAGIDQFEALLFCLQLPGSRSAKHFAGAFRIGAGRSRLLPLSGAGSLGSFRLRCGFWIYVAGGRNPDDSSEFAFFERLELIQS